MLASPSNPHSIIPKKQLATHEDFLHAEQRIESLVSQREIDDLAARTIEAIQVFLRTHPGTAYAWSGGKDSIALQWCATRAGITRSMFGHCQLEFPAFMQWVRHHAPIGLQYVDTGQDMAWLIRNRDMLFPVSSLAARWYAIVQNRAQDIYYDTQGLDAMVFGRRIADGNVVGTDGITMKGARVRFNPMALWRHEDVLALIHYEALPVPPIYGWPRGYKVGTGPWPKRRLSTSARDNWHETYLIDPSIVRCAAPHFPDAAHYLESRT